MPKCLAPGCINSNDKNVRMCRFPADPKRRAKWIANGNVQHFPSQQYFCEVRFKQLISYLL